MSEDIFRSAVKKMYPGRTSWSQRVDRMSDKQVHAIYAKNCTKKPERKVVIVVGYPVPEFRQDTLF